MSELVADKSALDYITKENYVVRKKILKIFGGAFHVYDPMGEVVMYSKMKAFKLKEDLRIYTGEDMETELLTIKARNVIDLGATYDVVDAVSGEQVGALRRKGLKSMLKDEWLILDANDNEIGKVFEDNMGLALIRRFVGGGLLSALMPQKYHVEMGESEVAYFMQNRNPYVYKLSLDLTHDPEGKLDKRLAMAAGILMAGIEGKQG